MVSPAQVTQAITQFADFLLKYFVALAAVGALTMALIEAWKKVFDSKTKFNVQYVQDFIADDIEAKRTSIQIETDVEHEYSSTFAELVHLMCGIEVDKAHEVTQQNKDKLLTVFSLEAANLMAKIQDAVDTAIDDPKRYPNLFIFATSGARTADAAAWMELAYMAAVNIDPVKLKTRADLYTRLHQLAKRKLDRLQLQLTYRWTNLNQLSANLLGILILYCTLLWVYAPKQGAMDPGDYFLIFLVSTTGGILSPIAKDMVSWLQKVKTGG
jgi:hypothetical protein